MSIAEIMTRERPRKIVVIHPDLGIGGAERLIVDACLELSTAGHEVILYTGFHDKKRCFEETIDKNHDRVPWIRVHGTWIPRHIFGSLHALFSILRSVWITAAALILERSISVFLVDQVRSFSLSKYFGGSKRE